MRHVTIAIRFQGHRYALRPERAIAFGKAALVENSAALIRKAGRETQLAPRYVDTMRERAAAFGGSLTATARRMPVAFSAGEV